MTCKKPVSSEGRGAEPDSQSQALGTVLSSVGITLSRSETGNVELLLLLLAAWGSGQRLGCFRGIGEVLEGGPIHFLMDRAIAFCTEASWSYAPTGLLGSGSIPVSVSVCGGFP